MTIRPHTAAVKPSPALNIGIYGCTHAGKTRFLYQLLAGWHARHQLLNCSVSCQSFLAAVQAEMSAYGQSKPTAAATESMSVEVRQEGRSTPWRLVFRDLRGELLADQLDQLEELTQRADIPAQVRQCDAFLFFFDPTCAEAPHRRAEHHRQELTRAAAFIDYVLHVRQNRHLPVVFVQTRLDEWENNPAVRSEASQWAAQVNQVLQKRYRALLKRHYPESLVDPALTGMAISNLRDRQPEQVIERVSQLAEDAGKFAARSRRLVKGLVLSGLILAALFLGLLVVSLVGSRASPHPSEKGIVDTPPIREWPPDLVQKQLDDLDRLLTAHDDGPALPAVDGAKKLNGHLRWLPLKLGYVRKGSGSVNGFPPELVRRLEESWQRAASVVRAKTAGPEDVTLPERLSILSAYLDGVRDEEHTSEELATAQRAYWKLYRRHAVRELSRTLRRDAETASKPATALKNVSQECRRLEQEVKGRDVDAREPKQGLLDELQDVATFCDNRQTAGYYTAKFRIVSATFVNKNGISPAPRRLELTSSVKEPLLQQEMVALKKSDEECRFEVPNEPVEVMLPLGKPVVVKLSIQSSAGGRWDSLFDIPLQSDRGADTLGVLGLPFVQRDGLAVQRLLRQLGYTLEIEFSDLPRAPALLWEAQGATAGGNHK